MRLIAEFFPEFAGKFEEIDELYREQRSIDEKTYQFICLALSIKNHSAPCVKKHFKGSDGGGSHDKGDRLYHGPHLPGERRVG